MLTTMIILCVVLTVILIAKSMFEIPFAFKICVHKKTNKTYYYLSHVEDKSSHDGQQYVLYMDDDRKLYIRSVDDFNDKYIVVVAR